MIRTLALLLLLVAGAARAQGPNAAPAFTVTDFATGFDHPWGAAFLPDGRLLVTERPGRLRLVGQDGQVSPPLGGVPAVEARAARVGCSTSPSPRISPGRGRSISATPCWCRVAR
ncbi:PQQ-dependent sugar dehydrogenase [Dankookia sp. P2]|uniref:PQQ-dependent sugar dehydrogenase n=1 Tax=Dankookia sp. P2 TaxID=3423955 RepID=UPI003D674372